MIYVIIDFNTNKKWATFDDNKRTEIVAYFKSLNNPNDFTVVTFKDNKEVSRCNLMDF